MKNTLKRDDIESCMFCTKGVLHANTPTFFAIDAGYYIANLDNIKKAHASEQLMGGVALARVLSPDYDLANLVAPQKGLICLDCASTKTIFSLLEGRDTE